LEASVWPEGLRFGSAKTRHHVRPSRAAPLAAGDGARRTPQRRRARVEPRVLIDPRQLVARPVVDGSAELARCGEHVEA